MLIHPVMLLDPNQNVRIHGLILNLELQVISAQAIVYLADHTQCLDYPILIYLLIYFIEPKLFDYGVTKSALVTPDCASNPSITGTQEEQPPNGYSHVLNDMLLTADKRDTSGCQATEISNSASVELSERNADDNVLHSDDEQREKTQQIVKEDFGSQPGPGSTQTSHMSGSTSRTGSLINKLSIETSPKPVKLEIFTSSDRLSSVLQGKSPGLCPPVAASGSHTNKVIDLTTAAVSSQSHDNHSQDEGEVRIDSVSVFV